MLSNEYTNVMLLNILICLKNNICHLYKCNSYSHLAKQFVVKTNHIISTENIFEI